MYAEIYIEKKTRKDIKLLSEDPSQTSGPTDEEQNGTDGIVHLFRASFQATGETAWQHSWIQTVYGCNVMAIAIFHSTSQYQISARDTYNFSSWENGAFLIMDATVCCQFYYRSEIEVIRKNLLCSAEDLH